MEAMFGKIVSFIKFPTKLYLILLGLLIFAAAFEFYSLGLARRTFVFYTIDSGEIAVEDRMLKRSALKEEDIIRYTGETLQGPASPKDLLPLFPLETKLKSLLLRDRAVYADFTESAALPLPEYIKKGVGGNVLDNFRTLRDSIIRNFSYVSDVWFFIEGNPISLDLAGEIEWAPYIKTDRPDEAVSADLPET